MIDLTGEIGVVLVETTEARVWRVCVSEAAWAVVGTW